MLPPAPGPAVDVLVLAAHAPDLVGFRSTLTEQMDATVRGLRVIAKSVGVGLPAASATVALRLVQARPRGVIFVGCCGIYPNLPAYRPLDVVVATRVSLLDHGALSDAAAYPEPMTTSIEPNAALTSGLVSVGTRVRATPVASSLARTSSETAGARAHRELGCDAESLEAFGVASACKSFNVPFAIALGAAYVVGPSGTADWKQYQRQASVSAAETVLAWLHTGAAGLPHA